MLTEPQPFEDALETLRRKLPYGSRRKTADWAKQATAVRERAFFSATIESIRFLARARLFLTDFLERNREETQFGTIALKADGRARFVRDMARFAIQEGLGPVGIPANRVDPNDITDIRSEARLKLIFDTQVKQAVGFGYWTQGMEPEVLRAFPAARFVRFPGAKEKRERHAASENQIKLKTDFAWWRWQNDPAIGGFGVPYPPFGFYSRMDMEDVSEAEAVELGLIDPEKEAKRPRLPGFNENLKASVKGLDPDLRRKLAQELGVKTPVKRDEIKPPKSS